MDLVEYLTTCPPRGDEADEAYDVALKHLQEQAPERLAALVEAMWHMDGAGKSDFEARSFKAGPAGESERSFWKRGLAIALEAASRGGAPVEASLIGDIWKAGRLAEESDPLLERVVRDACRAFKAIDAVPDLIKDRLLVEAACIDWDAAARRMPTLALRVEEGIGLVVVPDLPDARVAGGRFEVIGDIYRMMVVALPHHPVRRGKIDRLFEYAPPEIAVELARSVYYGLSRAQLLTRLPPDDVAELIDELETSWIHHGYSQEDLDEVVRSYHDGLRLEDRYFDALYRKE